MTYIPDDVPSRIADIYQSCSEEEQKYLKTILSELSATGTSETYEKIWLADYKEIPVSIDTFIESDTYLGKTNRNGKAVYPHWRKVLREIFDAGNKYQEVVLTGATRIGKSSTGITATAYMLYRLMCLKDPQKYFGKKEISKFSILFFNITKDLAKGVAFREFNDTLKASPWFNSHGTFSKSDKDFYYIPEGGKVVIDYGSSAAHALGMQVFVGFLDECNFSKAGIKDVNKAKRDMKDTYNTISARVKGTFRKNGEVLGKIFAISSKRSDSDFMEAYVKEQLDAGAGDHMYVDDKPQWEVLPPSMFSSEKFYIAVGDRHKRGFVIPDNQTFPEAINELKDQGYKILTPPIDMKSDFTADFDIALRDLAGMSVPGALSFITQDAISKCISGRQNCFYTDILQIGTKDNLTIEEFCHIENIKQFIFNPIYIHLDLSLNTDRTGISGACISSRKDVGTDSTGLVSQPFFSHLFSIALEAPRGDKIPYQKILEFICWLRKQGFRIELISRDQFQSEYLAELLESQGFKTSKISLDRTPDGYMALRSILLEERVDMIDCKLLQDELIHLQRDSVTGRIDHPVGGCFTGDTKIRLVDGRSLTILELLSEHEYRNNWVYTFNEDTQTIEPKRIKRIFQTKITADLIKVTLDNGQSIVCTPDHRFMLRDGSYAEIQDLTPGTSLMPLYTKLADKGPSGYRMYYEPMEDRWHYEHQKFCRCKKLVKGWVVHHCNYNKLDNCPDNLQHIPKYKHRQIHNNPTLDYKKVSFHCGRSKVGKNHKIVSIERIHSPCRVYDLTIEDNPNFALDAGVFVHNSKDVADSFAGCIWSAMLNNPGVPVPIKSVSNVISSVNNPFKNTSSTANNLGGAFTNLYRNNRKR